MVGKKEMNTRAYLSSFNFKGTDQQKKVGDLSGGERNRLHLAKTLAQGGNVLMLDEPSNDLDVETLRALEDALLEFAGSLMVISHDRWFLDRIATHILACAGASTWGVLDRNYPEDQPHTTKRLAEDGARPAPLPCPTAAPARAVAPRLIAVPIANTPAEFIPAVSAAPGRSDIGALLSLLTAVLFIPAAVAAGRLMKATTPKLAAVGTSGRAAWSSNSARRWGCGRQLSQRTGRRWTTIGCARWSADCMGVVLQVSRQPDGIQSTEALASKLTRSFCPLL